ncbi:MAG: hypothetical protein IBJ11_08280 [Phycisphaerales bacterium]|nr:hypothetical protein [Phycisphaerales bacterium]
MATIDLSPRLLPLGAAAAAVACICVSAARADPLNPLDFPSLGSVKLAAGAYSIDSTGPAPTLVGPNTHLAGTISVTGVAVFRFDELTVSPGAILGPTLGATGTTSRPVALLARDHLTFAGVFQARGADGQNGTRKEAGEGGAGVFGSTDGSKGVPAKPGGGAGAGITTEPHVRLSGGTGGSGGIASGSGTGGGGGGGGGGAIELGTLGDLNLSGSTIDASGGNGGAGAGVLGQDVGKSDLAGGAGGGSGGAILLHGRTVTLGGTIRAHGGDGGEGRGIGMSADGGRVSIQATTDPGTAGISVAGGRVNGAEGAITFLRPALTTRTLEFGSVPIGSQATAQLVVENSGHAGSCINGQFPDAAAPFARTGSGAFSGLQPTAAMTCAYTFRPTSAGPVSQTLTLVSNSGPVSVTIRGVGVPAPTPATAAPKP